MRTFPVRDVLVLSLMASVGACSEGPPSADSIPLVEGPLRLDVRFPAADAVIPRRDSNYIFGSVGNGRARLTVNGASVRVLRNGGFLAYLPTPAPDAPRYELVAVLGRDTVRATHGVRISTASLPLFDSGALVVDTAALTPRGPLVLRDDEWVRIGVRAPRNAEVWVQGDTWRRRLVNDAAPAREGLDSWVPDAVVDGGPPSPPGPSALWSTSVPARALRRGAQVRATRGGDTVRLAIAPVSRADPAAPRFALLGSDSATGDSDRVVVARPTPGGTFKWFLLPGTRVEVTGRSGTFARVRLDAALEVWVAVDQVRLLPRGAAGPARVADNVVMSPAEHWVDVAIRVTEPPAFLIEQRERELVVTLYGTRVTTDIIKYPTGDSLIRVVEWEQVMSDRARYTVRLGADPFGYRALWANGAFVLRVRRPPSIDAGRPLRGLTIAVDAGHPPAGSTGPTRLREADATLAVARRLERLLERSGATVVMTRDTDAPVALEDRAIIARRANAHALVSIHVDALAPGVNPFHANGTATFFFHPQSEPLARAVQLGMLSRMGLRDRGVYYDNLAMVRPTWMPAVLCEGATMTMPEHEAALRTDAFQEAYARGVADGLESFFRARARHDRVD